jgi:hypothetical protein
VWTASAQPGNHGLTDVARQRESILAVPLALDYHVAMTPINITELQAGHFTGA